MQLSHTPAAVSASFDDPNLVSASGLVPVMRLADEAGLSTLARNRLSVPTDKGSNAGAKIASLIGGMSAGADSVDDMDLLRHGGMSTLFTQIYAPSTLGSFLRSFTFGHVRQLDAVASRFLTNLAGQASALAATTTGDETAAGSSDYVFVDVDDTIIEVHGHNKQGVGFGCSGVRGLNALLTTVTTPDSAPVVVARRLRHGSCGSPRRAGRLVVRHIPELNPKKDLDQPGLFDLHRFHAVFTTTTIRRRLMTVPARLARSARRLVLHLSKQWKRESQWTRLFDHRHSPPAAAV